MRVAVLGASGFVGGYVQEKLQEAQIEQVGTCFQQTGRGLYPLDCRNRQDLESFLSVQGVDGAILVAAQPNVDWCEAHPKASYQSNVLPARLLAEIAAHSELDIIFISSDYIFDGLNGPYTEEALPHPLNVYGRHKLEAEKAVLACGGTVVRITVVYGWERAGKNFAARLIREVTGKRSVRVPEDQIGTPTYVEDIAAGLLEIYKRRLKGIYHLAAHECLSRYEFALHIAKKSNLDPRCILPVKTKDLGQQAPRPLLAGLVDTKFQSIAGWAPRSVDEGLGAMLNRISLEDGH